MQTDGEDRMMRSYFEGYGSDDRYPSELDFIDLTTVEHSPDIYHFRTNYDQLYPVEKVREFERDMESFVKDIYSYECEDTNHEWFMIRGVGPL
jgi:hypothetical protein